MDRAVMLTIDLSRQSGITILRPRGDLTGGPADPMVETAVAEIDQGARKLIVCLDAVQMITSSGLGDLVRIAAHANTHDGRLLLAAPSPFVADVLRTTRLDSFFEVCLTPEEALARLT